MSAPASSSRFSRVPQTPSKRPLSTATTSTSSGLPTPNLLNTAKKFKAALSSEARIRTTSHPTPAAVPPTPRVKHGSFSSNSASVALPTSPNQRERRKTVSTSSFSLDVPRPRTPGTPGRSHSPFGGAASEVSEMDVSRVDPEEVLVDASTMDHADVSMELDEQLTGSAPAEYGKQDKVLVSIRVRPSNAESAWDISAPQTIKLLSFHTKSTTSSPPQYSFDEVLTGSTNRPVYKRVARSHVTAAMEGYNAVVFAYGQTASGKTFTLSGTDGEPGIIPLAMKDVFAHIRRTPTREYLLRCSYIEIYNEQLHDLLAAPAAAAAAPVQLLSGGVLSPLREEVVTSLKGVREVLERGARNRRTACTDWNERSSRSHSVFRLVIESRERGATGESGRSTTPGGSGGRQTPSRPQTPYSRPCTPGGTRLQTIGGRSVQTSVLSLIDLAGSEKATSDKERTREGKFINTSLLTLGNVISTLGENASKNKTDHVPYRNSKLTRLLQPSLSGDARISVVCTINPDASAIAESTSTLGFASRIKKVQLHAQKKEVVDTDALIERYRKEIEGLKGQLAAREADAPARARRFSAQERAEESRAMGDLNARIRQLTKLILTSQSVDEEAAMRGDAGGGGGGSASQPGSPSKVDFDMNPYQLQQELLSARRQIDTQENQILSLEAALLARPLLPPDAPDTEKDKLLAEQGRTIRELEIVVRGYEENLGEPLRAVREDVEQEWEGKLEAERKRREEGEVWAAELVKELEKEKRLRQKFEEERRALAAFVSKFDSIGSSIGLGLSSDSTPSSASSTTSTAKSSSGTTARPRPFNERALNTITEDAESPLKLRGSSAELMKGPTLLEEEWSLMDDVSLEMGADTVPSSRNGSKGRKENVFA